MSGCDFPDPAKPAVNASSIIQATAPSLGMDVSPIKMRNASEIERAIAASRAPRRSDRDAECADDASSQADHRACGTAQPARHLPRAGFDAGGV